MKSLLKSFLLVVLLNSNNILSMSFKVVGPCDNKALFEEELFLENYSENLGELTKQVFIQNGISHVGTFKMMSMIYDIPNKDQRLEIISDVEMYAYGWCFSVNGKVPESYANKVQLNESDKVVWFMASSRYLKGKWINQCEYVNLRKPKIFCSDK